MALINAGQFMELQDLLSFPEFHPLKPAVLLMGWSQCVTSAHARTLIDTLWDELVRTFFQIFCVSYIILQSLDEEYLKTINFSSSSIDS